MATMSSSVVVERELGALAAAPITDIADQRRSRSEIGLGSAGWRRSAAADRSWVLGRCAIPLIRRPTPGTDSEARFLAGRASRHG